MFVKVIFPLKVKAFSYKIPTDLPHDLIGRIVRAPLVNREMYGIVSGANETEGYIEDKSGKIKEILSIHGHLGSPSIIPFINWLSSYYLNPVGIALSCCFFKEAVSIIHKPRVGTDKSKSKPTATESEQLIEKPSNFFYGEVENAVILKETIQKKKFSAFTLHCPSIIYERGFLCEILKNIPNISGAIVLVPEISRIDKTASMLKAMLGGRVCSLHSKQTRKNRIETLRGILSGKHDIVVGTRSAVFAPLKKVSFIAVTGEHSPLYKAEEGLRYNARDVAVMRGFLEKAPVLLSSICPSIESIYNVRNGKFIPLKVRDTQTEAHSHGFSLFSAKKRPVIEIINTGSAEKDGRSIPVKIISNSKKQLAKKEHLLFVVSTQGYSLIMCADCGYIFRCHACNSTLRFYKNEGVLKCRLCGWFRGAPDTCAVCGGIQLKAFGSGAERIREEIEKSFGKRVLILNKNNLIQNTDTKLMPFVIGRGGQMKRLAENIFTLAVFFDADLFLSEASFRSNEKVFQSLIEISQLIKSGGRIFIPTRHPKNKILKFIKNYDFKGFYKNELLLRKETSFPPFSRLILFNILFSNRAFNDIEKFFLEKTDETVQIYGPVEVSSPVKKHKYCLQYLLKSRDRKRLNSFAALLKDRLDSLKGIKVVTDVDPIKV